SMAFCTVSEAGYCRAPRPAAVMTALVICTSPGPCCPDAQTAEVSRIAVAQSQPFAAPGFWKISLQRPFLASNPRVLLQFRRKPAVAGMRCLAYVWGGRDLRAVAPRS